jgi:hypothetical protein
MIHSEDSSHSDKLSASQSLVPAQTRLLITTLMHPTIYPTTLDERSCMDIHRETGLLPVLRPGVAERNSLREPCSVNISVEQYRGVECNLESHAEYRSSVEFGFVVTHRTKGIQTRANSWKKQRWYCMGGTRRCDLLLSNILEVTDTEARNSCI